MTFRKRDDGLERELRRLRREPRPEFVQAVVNRIQGDRYRRPKRPWRLGLAVALTAAMVAALAAFGGLGYAASGVSHAVESAVHVVSPTKNATPNSAMSSAAAQYKVAMCLRGHTIFVDSHAVKGILIAGGKIGACTGAAAPPGSRKLVPVCFHGQTILVEKRSVRVLLNLGATRGRCKKK
jgi:hypothetical protein